MPKILYGLGAVPRWITNRLSLIKVEVTVNANVAVILITFVIVLEAIISTFKPLTMNGVGAQPAG